MKNCIITLLLVAMMSVLGYAQSIAGQSSPSPSREVTFSQQLALLKAGKDNPAKAQPLEMDERMNHQMASEKDFGPSNDKAQPIEESEQRPENRQPLSGLPESQVKPQVNESTSAQPIGVKSETVVNYRSVSGGDAQSQPEESGNVINYKSIKGGHEQPIGKVPEKLN
jgi:hypothetical protein